jgi:DNA-binding NarL/FixJ family response regulator
MVGGWPLRGRAGEYEATRRGLVDAPGAAVLVGDAGVGKTRLARELADDLAAEGRTVEWVAATQASAGVPFGPFVRFLGDDPPQSTETLLLHQITTRLKSASDEPPILVVDDAHLLDDGSAALVHQLAQSRAFKVLATVRTGQRCPDAVQRLWRDGQAVRVDLAPFDTSQVRQLLESALEGPVDTLTISRLGRATGGNPLFLKELVEAGIADDSLRQVDGVWQWTGARTLSSRVTDLLQERFDGCDHRELETLRQVALAEPVDVDVLAQVVEQRTVEALVDRGLLHPDSSGATVQLPHPLYGEVLRAGMSPVTARRLRRALVHAMKEPTDPDQLLRWVTLSLDAGERPANADLVAASSRALLLFDPTLGERLARAAAENPARTLLLARALGYQGRYEEAENLLAGQDTRQLDDAQLAAYLRIRGENLCEGLQRPDLALAYLDALPPKPAVRQAVACVRIEALVYAGDYRAAIDVAEAEPGFLDQPEAAPVPTLVMALEQVGRSEEALQLAQAYEKAAALPTRFAGYGRILVTAGRLDEADQVADQHIAAGTAWDWAEFICYGLRVRAQVAFARGRFQDSAHALRECVSLARDLSLGYFVRLALSGLSTAEAACGRIAEARAAMAESERLTAASPAVRALTEQDQLAYAFVEGCEGSMRSAYDRLDRLVAYCVEERQPRRAVEALHLMARFGYVARAASRLGDLASQCDSPVPHAHEAHIRALASGDAQELWDVSTRYVRLGMLHQAAEVVDMAAARFLAAGNRRSAGRAASERDRLLASCDTGPFRWWASAASSSPLSEREQQVATLAASGLTNREIAAQLVLSVRTVENHLQRIYVKTGLTNRSDLANWLTAQSRLT